MSRFASDQGVTLMELLIGMLITAVLILAVGGSLVIGVNTTESAGKQVNEASWSRVVSNWFLTDVHGANSHSASANCLPPDGPAQLMRSFELDDEPEVSLPSTTTTTLVPPTTTTTIEPPPSTVPPEPTTTTEPEVTTHYVEWWRGSAPGGISVIRTTCTVVTPLPDPPDPDYPPTSSEVIAADLASVSVSCSGASCTLNWSGGATGEDYGVTASRRLP